MIKFFKWILPLAGAIGLGYLATTGEFGANIETSSVATGSAVSYIMASIVDILKNGMPGMVVKKAETEIAKVIGEDEAAVIMSVVKDKGMQWLMDQVQDGFTAIKEIQHIMPLFLAIADQMNKNGAFDESPQLKQIVEGTLDNVSNQ